MIEKYFIINILSQERFHFFIISIYFTGNDLIADQRTEKIAETDVKSVHTDKLCESKHMKSMRLSWNHPENINGMIVSYSIRYQRVDIDHVKLHEVCISGFGEWQL